MQKFVIPLSIVGMADAIAYMIVAPSIIFYVLENGGDQSQYGIILSVFSFASFCTKPFLGSWTDRGGFRIPYFVSLGTSSLGGLLYFLAYAFPKGYWAVLAIFVARCLSGVGAANTALGYAYIAKMLPSGEQTKMNSLLSMIRIFGMAAGPGVNVFLSHVDFEIFGYHVDHLNSVGLFLVVLNLVAVFCIYQFLDEPESEEDEKETLDSNTQKKEDFGDLIKNILSFDICVYLLSIFSFNANFQIIETAFAPAAKDALNWGPVQTSTVLGSMSIIIFFVMLLVFQLSARKVSDQALLSYGLIHGGLGYTLLYFLWTKEASVAQYAIPVVLGASSFPFLGAPTRSLFTKIVDSKPALDHHHGFMQAMLSMGASVAGFVSPGLIATFVLRKPEEVLASKDQRELTSFALFAPAMSVVVLIGHIYVQRQILSKEACTKGDLEDPTPDETSALKGTEKRNTSVLHKNRYLPRQASHRQSSCSLMGVNQPHIFEEDVLEDEE